MNTAEPLSIDHAKDDEAFIVVRDGKRIAEMTYTFIADDLIRIDHTEVDESLKGQGVGKRLVMAAAEWARASDLRIVPRCSFARGVFEKEASLADVRAAD